MPLKQTFPAQALRRALRSIPGASAPTSCLVLILVAAGPAIPQLRAADLEECQRLLRESPGTAEVYCLDLLQDESVALDRDMRTRLQIDMGSNAIVRGDFSAAERYLDDALMANQKLLENNFYRYNWLRTRALVDFRQDRFAAGLPYMREALDVALALDNDRAIATSYNDIGASSVETGDYLGALTNFQKALQYLKRLGNHYSTGLTLANIAAVYRDLDDPTSAIQYLQRSLDAHSLHLESEPDDFYARRARAQAQEDLGVTYTQLGRLKEARESLAAALDIYNEADLYLDQIRVLAANAEIEIEEGNPNAALGMLNRALELEHSTPPKRSVQTRRGLTTAYRAADDPESAVDAAREGLTLAQETGQAPDELFFLKELMELSSALGRQDASDAYRRQYLARFEESLEKRYQLQVAELQSNIQLQQQEEDILALETQTRDLRRSVRLQRVLIVAAALVVLLLLALIALVMRHRSIRRRWLAREIALHRQEFDTEHSAPYMDLHDEDLANEGSTEVPQESIDDDTPQASDFDTALVRLMRSCIEIWEQSTGTSRIELAEQSRIWQVTVDNGRLRTRTMDRYSDIKKLPKVPRWRQVVRTCRYILINCELHDAQRQRLNDELEQVFAIQRSDALSADA